MSNPSPTKQNEAGDFWRYPVDADGYLEVFQPRDTATFIATAAQSGHRRMADGLQTFREAARAARQMHVGICADHNIVVF
jgi:hypothetical protein